MSRAAAAFAAATLLTPPAFAAGESLPSAEFPSDAEIHALLVERVDALGGPANGVGIIVGVIDPQGRRVIAYGQRDRGDSRSPDGNTLFEIGSVTKVFTALLLADMVRRGEVALTDPVAKYLPAGALVPEHEGRSITLLDLATHTSGLPFMPAGMPDIDDPAPRYSVAQIYDFLAHCALTHDIGTKWSYSNLGYWLLGQALAGRANADFEQLLVARVLAPLRLKNTAIRLSPAAKTQLASGHDAVLGQAPHFSDVPGFRLMKPAGGLVSSANELLSLLSVVMSYERAPLSASLAAMLETRRPLDRKSEQALGWVVMDGQSGEPLIFHDGGTFGFASSVAWDPKRRIGVVVLSNQVTQTGDVARHLLRPDLPLEHPTATRRTEITLASAALDAFPGQYEVKDAGVFIVARQGAFLTFAAPPDWGLPKLRLHPETPRDFFASELPLRVTFEPATDAHAAGALIYPPRGQRALHADKLSR
jgi:CubicO group peptidase (beta-lactamase class C family)